MAIRPEIEERLLKLESILAKKEAKLHITNEDLEPTNEILPLIAAAAKAVAGGVAKGAAALGKSASSALGKALTKAASGGEAAITKTLQAASKSASSTVLKELPDVLNAVTQLQEVTDMTDEGSEQSEMIKQFIELGKKIGAFSQEMNK